MASNQSLCGKGTYADKGEAPYFYSGASDCSKLWLTISLRTVQIVSSHVKAEIPPCCCIKQLSWLEFTANTITEISSFWSLSCRNVKQSISCISLSRLWKKSTNVQLICGMTIVTVVARFHGVRIRIEPSWTDFECFTEDRLICRPCFSIGCYGSWSLRSWSSVVTQIFWHFTTWAIVNPPMKCQVECLYV